MKTLFGAYLSGVAGLAGASWCRWLQAVALGCALVAAAPAKSARAFDDAGNVFARGEHPSLAAVGGFVASQQRLAEQFHNICGDTFCAGDFTNLQALSLSCSVDAESQQVGQCVWVFAGSYADIGRLTGKVQLHKQIFECDLGVQGSVEELGNFLARAADGGVSGDQGLRQVKIPGSDRTLLDVLLGCL